MSDLDCDRKMRRMLIIIIIVAIIRASEQAREIEIEMPMLFNRHQHRSVIFFIINFRRATQ